MIIYTLIFEKITIQAKKQVYKRAAIKKKDRQQDNSIKKANNSL